MNLNHTETYLKFLIEIGLELDLKSLLPISSEVLVDKSIVGLGLVLHTTPFAVI